MRILFSPEFCLLIFLLTVLSFFFLPEGIFMFMPTVSKYWLHFSCPNTNKSMLLKPTRCKGWTTHLEICCVQCAQTMVNECTVLPWLDEVQHWGNCIYLVCTRNINSSVPSAFNWQTHSTDSRVTTYKDAPGNFDLVDEPCHVASHDETGHQTEAHGGSLVVPVGRLIGSLVGSSRYTDESNQETDLGTDGYKWDYE